MTTADLIALAGAGLLAGCLFGAYALSRLARLWPAEFCPGLPGPGKCERAGCPEYGPVRCVLPDGEVYAHYCPLHAQLEGFCWQCGRFLTGEDDGICDACRADLADDAYDEDPEDALDTALSEGDGEGGAPPGEGDPLPGPWDEGD